MASPKLGLGITQARIVTNCKELSDKNDDYLERKHNPKTPGISPIRKSYHEQRGKPSLIRNAG